MAKGAYVGVAGVARKVKSQYVGVAGVARKVKKAYAGVAGVARLCWQNAKTVSVPTQSGSLTYSGSAQSPAWSGYDSNAMTIGGTTSATNAGTYTATFTLKSGYVWPDGTAEKKNVTWTIKKANASFSVSPGSSSLNPYSIKRGETKTFSISCSGCTVANAVSSNTARLTVDSFSSEEIVVTAVNTGASGTECTVSITLNAEDNYTIPTTFLMRAIIYLEIT